LIADAEKIDVSAEALKEIARSGEGSMRDAQSNFDQVISFSGEKIGTDEVINALGMASAEMLTKTILAISDRNPAVALEVVDELISRGQDLRHFCRDLLSFFRDLLLTKLASDLENLLDTSILPPDEMRKYAEPFTEADLIRFFNSLSETDLKLHNALQPRYILEIGLVKLIEMRRVVQIEDILTRLAKLESIGANGTSSQTGTITIQPAAEQAISEKKTLIAEIPDAEFPFPVNSVGNFEGSKKDENPVFTEEIPDFLIDDEYESAPPPPEPSEFIKQFNANIVDNYSIDVSSITFEELEHIEDSWLDAAYEKKLELAGDSLTWIPNASEIVEVLVGIAPKKELPEIQIIESAFGASAGDNKDFSHLIPQLNEDEESHEIPELPEDPNDEQLLQFASAHPIVKKALKIFRGKIVEVKKI
jgi:DNA polymerase III gamma/tau subunit